MRRMLTAPDLDLVNLILSRDSALADHLLGKLDTLSAALGPVSNGTPPAGAAEGKRPLPDTGPGPGGQPGGKGDNHRRIVDYLKTNGPSGPAAIKEALALSETDWIKGLSGTPTITATGKGAGRKYGVA
jgi:hypothetical protein